MRPGARAGLLLTLLAVLTVGVACGGGAPVGRGPARPHRGAPVAAPAPRLVWRQGRSFDAKVVFQESDHVGSGTPEQADDVLSLVADEVLTVTAAGGGMATLRVSVTAWYWRRNTSGLLTRPLPPPTACRVDRAGRIVAGDDWPLPLADLPLPGLDLLAAPLSSSGAWPRTDAEGLTVAYQVTAGAPAAGDQEVDHLGWSVRRYEYTASGVPLTLTGRAQATVTSDYRAGTGLSLRSTAEHATYQRTETSAEGSIEEAGTISETTTFAAAP